MKTKFIYLYLFLQLSFPVLAEINLLEQKNFINKPLPHFDWYTDDGHFIPAKDALKKRGNYFDFIYPEAKKDLRFLYTALGPFPVNEMTGYRLNITVQQMHRTFKSMYKIVYLQEDKVLNTDSIFNLRKDLPGAAISVSKDFGTPEHANKIKVLLCVASYEDYLNKKHRLTFHKITLEKLNPILSSPRLKPYLDQNLSFLTDFEDMPLGAIDPQKTKAYFGKGKDYKGRWHSIDADIVSDKGNQCMRLVRKNKAFQYPRFSTKRLPLYYNSTLTLKAKVKGKGEIRLGLWWISGRFSFDHFHGNKITLTDQWTEVEVSRSCIDAQARAAVWAVNFGPENDVELFIDDVRLELVSPVQ
jgi:hypothetical protein